MKKKVSKKKKPAPVLRDRKSKIDVVIESLVNLEQRTKELIDKVKGLEKQIYYHPKNAEPKQYWPNHPHNIKWNPPEYN